MGKLIGVEISPVSSGLYDTSNVAGGNNGTKTPSCMGLPGAGLPAAYLYFESSIIVLVDDAENVYAGVSGGFTGNGSISGGEFPARLYVKPQHFTITDPFASTDQISSFTMTKGGEGLGLLRYEFAGLPVPAVGATSWDARYVKIGTLSSFTVPGSGTDGYAWIAGCAYYQLTNPIYPGAVRFTIPNFMRYLSYFPGSIRKGGALSSANRPGGSLAIRKGGWLEVKNSEDSSAPQQGFIRRGSSWVHQAKTGVGA